MGPAPSHVRLVALGGALGALARVALGLAFPSGEHAWPAVTLAVNLGGALALGVLVTVIAEALPGRGWVRPLLGTGVLGAFTTFSTVALELQQSVAGGGLVFAAGYAVASIVGGLAAAAAGIAGVRALVRARRDVR